MVKGLASDLEMNPLDIYPRRIVHTLHALLSTTVPYLPRQKPSPVQTIGRYIGYPRDILLVEIYIISWNQFAISWRTSGWDCTEYFIQIIDQEILK
jgi:hypothetical protein